MPGFAESGYSLADGDGGTLDCESRMLVKEAFEGVEFFGMEPFGLFSEGISDEFDEVRQGEGLGLFELRSAEQFSGLLLLVFMMLLGQVVQRFDAGGFGLFSLGVHGFA